MQSLCLKDYFLVGTDMVHGGQVIGVRIIDDSAEAGEAAVVHVFVEIFERAVFAYDELGAKLMVASAFADTGVLCAVKYHCHILRLLLALTVLFHAAYYSVFV